MRVLALDMGDVWVGSAISDGLGITCRPLETVKRPELNDFLARVMSEYEVGTVVVGLPTPMSGNDSEQTVKTRAIFAQLKVAFPGVLWDMIDERLTSHQALEHQRDVKKQHRTKESKRESHSIAAFMLKEYLNK